MNTMMEQEAATEAGTTNGADTQSGTMRAIVHTNYGSPEELHLREVEKPVVGADEVLVRVHTAAVNRGDWHILTGKPYLIRMMGYGMIKPKNGVFGQEFAGVIEAVGKNVTRFQTGDRVFGEAVSGAFAEYLSVSPDKIAIVPDGVSFESAAASPSSGLTALQGLRDIAKVKAGQKVLVNGASGGVGSFAVQLAKFFGAEVTGVCSTANIEMVRAIGADYVIDYTKTDFSTTGKRYDVFFDLVGNRSLAESRKMLSPGGIYLACSGGGGDLLGPIPRLLKMSAVNTIAKEKMVPFVMEVKPENLDFLAGRLAAGDVTPAIGRKWELSEVPEAMRVSGSGRAAGKLVISI